MSTNAAYQPSSPKRTTDEADAVRVALIDDDELFREALGMNLLDEGYDVVSFDGGESALSYFQSDGGRADIIGMARALICDPDFAVKAGEGRSDDIRACIGCNQACVGHRMSLYPVSCIQHPESGRETEFEIRTVITK